jgi:hypothetical protein
VGGGLRGNKEEREETVSQMERRNGKKRLRKRK